MHTTFILTKSFLRKRKATQVSILPSSDPLFGLNMDLHSERLVHGPLTAMMLLETAVFFHPEIQIKSFEYRARNPVIVNRLSTIKGVWIDKATIKLWCIDEDGVVGMTGTVNLV